MRPLPLRLTEARKPTLPALRDVSFTDGAAGRQ